MGDVSVERPKVSIVLAVRDDEQSVGGCLQAIAGQAYPLDLAELIVAVAQSRDQTRKIVQRHARSIAFPVTIVDNPRGSAASGFNAGLRRASGDVIVLLGARARPDSGFLAANVAALERSGAEACGGVVNGQANSEQGEVLALALGSSFGVGDASYRHSRRAGEVDTINYGAYRREVFAWLGGFDETMDNVEDDEFNYRLRARGGRLFLTPEIRCGYLVRDTILAGIRQYVRYGFPKVRVLRRHPRQMRPRQFVPAVFVAALLSGTVAAPWSRAARRMLWLTLGSYVAACLTVSARIAARTRWHYLALLPVAFAGIHLGYGAASLAGAVRFLLWPALCGLPEPLDVPAVMTALEPGDWDGCNGGAPV
ncbi:MAG: glycosyltransferase family 2 protein [Dehalococcoidia bacterium]